MELTPKEIDKLMIFSAAMLAERRKNKGLKLNYPEAVALISFEILEGAREGKTVAQLMGECAEILTEDDVMPGVAAMIDEVQAEATFPDGTKLVTVHSPIQPSKNNQGENEITPGEIKTPEKEFIALNSHRVKIRIVVANQGDRPIQVGSHYHFYETNEFLDFDREITKGFRLNIPAGNSVRFEPGQEREVELVRFVGEEKIYGFQAKIMGKLQS